MKIKLFPVMVCGLALLQAGCDPLAMFRNREQEERARQEVIKREEREKVQIRTKSELESTRIILRAQQKSLEDERVRADKIQKELREDRSRFSSRLSATVGTDLSAKAETSADTLFALLSDAAINELAYKYLGNDFALARTHFAGRVRTLRSKDARVRSEVKQIDEEYAAKISYARVDDDKSRREGEQAVKRLERDIAESERRLASLRRDSLATSKDSRQRQKDQIAEEEQRLRSLRQRYTAMDVADKAARQRADAVRMNERLRNAARRDRREDIERIRKSSAGMPALADVVSEFEKDTIVRLDAEITRLDRDCRTRIDGLRQTGLFISEVLEGIGSLDENGIRDIRANVTGRIAAIPGLHPAEADSKAKR